MQTLVLWCQECAFISEVDWSGWVYTVLKAVQSIFYCNTAKNVQYGVDLVVVEECTWRYITLQPCKQQCNNQWRELEWWDVHSAKVVYNSAKWTKASSEMDCMMYTVQKLCITMQQSVKCIGVVGLHSAKAVYNSAKCTRANSEMGWCGMYSVQKRYI